MINLYVLQDALTLQCGEIFTAQSDPVVVRLMTAAASSPEMSGCVGLADMTAYRIGTFDPESLELLPCKPVPIYRMSSALAAVNAKGGDAPNA